MTRYQRLRGRERIERLRREGGRVRRGGLSLVWAPSDGGIVRVGFVAGRKVGTAVERNRAKRRLREAARRVGLNPGHDFLVVAHRQVLEADFQTLVDWLHDAAADSR